MNVLSLNPIINHDKWKTDSEMDSGWSEYISKDSRDYNAILLLLLLLFSEFGKLNSFLHNTVKIT